MCLGCIISTVIDIQMPVLSGLRHGQYGSNHLLSSLYSLWYRRCHLSASNQFGQSRAAAQK